MSNETSLVRKVVNRLTSEVTVLATVLLLVRYVILWPYETYELEEVLVSVVTMYGLFRGLALVATPILKVSARKPGMALLVCAALVAMYKAHSPKDRRYLVKQIMYSPVISPVLNELGSMWNKVDSGNRMFDTSISELFKYITGPGSVSLLKATNSVLFASIWFMLISVPVYTVLWVVRFVLSILLAPFGLFPSKSKPAGYECVDGVCRKVEESN